jgi:UDPglucose 6-dehydrogenase
MAQKIRTHFGNLQGRTFAIWGLAFKPNTDDLREAPALALIDELLEAGALVRAFDPVAGENARRVYGTRIELCESGLEAARGADALVVVTEWNEFRHPNFEQLKTLLKKPVIFDGRNIFNPTQLAAEGFTYYGIGRSRT